MGVVEGSSSGQGTADLRQSHGEDTSLGGYQHLEKRGKGEGGGGGVEGKGVNILLSSCRFWVDREGVDKERIRTSKRRERKSP